MKSLAAGLSRNIHEHLDRCRREISEVYLDDIVNCDFYKHKGEVPPVYTSVYVAEQTRNGRFRVLLTEDHSEIGLLPAEYSYLLACISKGYTYTGSVIYKEDGQFPKVVVKLHGN